MPIELPALPYKLDALAPHISKETLEYHYGKHHKTYVDKLNGMIPNTEFEDLTLEKIIQKSSGGIFNNAAQVWNHTFYWNCMSPNGGNEPTGKLADAIKKAFGSFDNFKTKFTQLAATHFGSGWTWLVKNADKQLEIYSTLNAENPMKNEQQALLTCDVWEHAYYIDTRNNRLQYINNWWNLVNWQFVSEHL